MVRLIYEPDEVIRRRDKILPVWRNLSKTSARSLTLLDIVSICIYCIITQIDVIHILMTIHKTYTLNIQYFNIFFQPDVYLTTTHGGIQMLGQVRKARYLTQYPATDQQTVLRINSRQKLRYLLGN